MIISKRIVYLLTWNFARSFALHRFRYLPTFSTFGWSILEIFDQAFFGFHKIGVPYSISLIWGFVSFGTFPPNCKQAKMFRTSRNLSRSFLSISIFECGSSYLQPAWQEKCFYLSSYFTKFKIWVGSFVN